MRRSLLTITIFGMGGLCGALNWILTGDTRTGCQVTMGEDGFYSWDENNDKFCTDGKEKIYFEDLPIRD